MLQHTHFKSSSDIIHTTAHMLADACQASTVEQKRNINVLGITGTKTKIDVVDRVASVAARKLYFASIGATEEEQESALNCTDCKGLFLSVLDKHELEISLKVMDILRKRGIPSSCEHVGYDPSTKSVGAFIRQTASLQTQEPMLTPPVYLGSFEKVCEIQQREFAVSTANAPRPILATWHLSCCVAVAGYDAQHKVGFLFHIDEGSDVKGAIQELVNILKVYKASTLSFEYILLGGADNQWQKAKKKKSTIETAFNKSLTPQIKFTRREYQEKVEIPFGVFMKDSYWSRAIRLCRSVALDLTLKDPLSQLMSYEAVLNPYSTFHKREHTLEEADQFCLMQKPKMQCVYTGVPS